MKAKGKTYWTPKRKATVRLTKVVRTKQGHGFHYRLYMLMRKPNGKRGNPYRWICIAIGTKHLKDLY